LATTAAGPLVHSTEPGEAPAVPPRAGELTAADPVPSPVRTTAAASPATVVNLSQAARMDICLQEFSLAAPASRLLSLGGRLAAPQG